MTNSFKRGHDLVKSAIIADRLDLLAVLLESDRVLDALIEVAQSDKDHLYLQQDWLKRTIDEQVERVALARIQDPQCFCDRRRAA